jgi:hypothetical protein
VVNNDIKGKIVYIALPYAGDTETNVEFAVEACRYCIEQGFTPIAPHLIYPQILNDNVPEQREIGRRVAADNKVSSCYLSAATRGCGDRISDGMYAELIAAMSLGIPHRRVFAEEILPQSALGMGAMTL